HAGRHGTGGAVDDGHAEGDADGRSVGARGSRLRALGGAARPSDDGEPAQCREPGGRLHVAGERAGACRCGRTRHAAGGGDQRRFLGADRLLRDRRVPVPHPRALRHRRRAGARPFPRGAPMIISASTGVIAILLIPVAAAALFALLPGYRISSRLNVLASFLTFLASLSLFFGDHGGRGPYLFVDDLNIPFIVLNTFVGFPTSVFSASHLGPELEPRRLTPAYLPFYTAMYQVVVGGLHPSL